jgi:hypothetical protein
MAKCTPGVGDRECYAEQSGKGTNVKHAADVCWRV